MQKQTQGKSLKSIIIIFTVIMLGTVILGLKIHKNSETTSSLGMYERQIESAISAQLPTWLLLHSKTCASCIEMEEIFNQLKPEYGDNIAFIDVDVNSPEAQNLNYTYKIEYIPTTIFLNAKGEQTFRHVGVIPTEEMKNKLTQLLEEN